MTLMEELVMNLLLVVLWGFTLPYFHFWPQASPPSGYVLSLCARWSIKIISPLEYSKNY